MVVEHAFRRVQDLVLFDAAAREVRQHVFEVARRRLVGADVLGRVDRIERHPELLVAVGEALVVDVGQNDQLVVVLQVRERGRAVGEGGPVAHRPAVGEALVPAGRHAPFLGQAPVDHGEQPRIKLVRRLALRLRLVIGMGLEDLVARQRPPGPLGQRFETFDHAALPVDQRAVDIEGKGFEIAEAHGGSPRSERDCRGPTIPPCRRDARPHCCLSARRRSAPPARNPALQSVPGDRLELAIRRKGRLAYRRYASVTVGRWRRTSSGRSRTALTTRRTSSRRNGLVRTLLAPKRVAYSR